MWICRRCQNENRETFSLCEHCGSPRSAGRFASAPLRMDHTGRAAPVAPPPRVMHIPEHRKDIRMPDDAIPDPLPEMKAQPAVPAEPYKLPRRPVMGLAQAVGMLLCILLPALAGFLAWRQYDVLQPALVSLLLDEAAPAWAKIAVYAGFCLIGALLAPLPGLWTLMKIPPKCKKRKIKEADEE